MHIDLGLNPKLFYEKRVSYQDFKFEFFAEKVFGIDKETAKKLTSDMWGSVDNTPYGAGQRLLYLLKTGEILNPCQSSVERYEKLKPEDFTDWKNELKDLIN